MGVDLSPKEEIRRAADIVDLIGQFVQLRKAGRNFVGLCPFHGEKDPSFTVNPERQTFHCFGCKKGGDIFAFWMEYHGTTFPEALEDLAERYNVIIPKRFSSSITKDTRRDALFRINEKAASYYESVLAHPSDGKCAREYLEGRSVGRETISEMRLGYAPDDWNCLTRVLMREHFDMGLAVQTGVVVPKKSGGYYDRFRGRIVFPIFDLRDHIVGFGGRVLDNTQPKYMNTPETPIFHKGELLYGLHVAYKKIRDKARAIIVEGYMDWLALRKYHIDYAVATLGTALTSHHVRKLRGYAKEVLVVFDSDEAGKMAALRSLPLFINEGLPARVVVLPDGHDPDSFINENGTDRFLELMDDAVPMLDFYLEMEIAGRDSDEDIVRVLKEFLPVLSTLNNDALRSVYVRRLSEKIGIREAAVWSELKKLIKKSSSTGFKRDPVQRVGTLKAKKKITDLQLLNLLIFYPESVSRLIDTGCRMLISDPLILEVVDAIFEKYIRDGKYTIDELFDSLKSEAACEELREILHRPFIVYSEEEANQAITEFEKKARNKVFVDSLKKARGDAETMNHLIKSEFYGPDAP